jgi:hypothetical protein
MIKPKRHTDWLDFHPGGVPAGIMFDMQVKDACDLADMRPSDKDDLRCGVGAEFALIALVAHFEGFCKNHTAAIINICPQLVRGLAERGREIRLRPIDILDYGENLSTQFGSLVVEKVDFGTAKAINGFYKDLLGITPFSRREANRFHALLEDRHLIVHHGNIFTPNYASERFIRREMGRTRIFFDSLKVTPADVRAAARLLHALSVKVRNGSSHALAAFVKKSRLRLAKPNREAVKLLGVTAPKDS